jgi:multidrug efflux pump subunit AcrA (membrane-fusion protein)
MDTPIAQVNKTNKFFELFKKITKHKFLTAAIIIAVLVASFFGFRSLKGASAGTAYATASVTKGTLIVTTTGTGQVDVTKQIEVKSKASGEVLSVKVAGGDQIPAGTVIAQIDTEDAQKTIRDASLSLENAQISLAKITEPADEYTISQSRLELEQAITDLEDLQDPTDSTELISAQNAVAQAKRDLEQAEDNFEKITLDTAQSLENAYDEGYTAVSNAYLDLPDLMDDAYNVESYEKTNYTDDNIGSYKIILGDNSTFISSFLSEYESAKKLYDTSFKYFKTVQRSEDAETAYQLISDTYETVKAVGNALESARNLLDAIVNEDNYEDFVISETVDLLRPIILDDLPTINKHISALQSAKDTIDSTNLNSPVDLKNAQDSIDSSKEKLKEKQTALNDIKDGPTETELATAQLKVKQLQADLDDIIAGSDPLDIRTQELNVQQKLNDLNDAKLALADYSVSVPFDAIVAEVNINEGDDISSGTSVATAITNQMIATVSLNEVDVAKIKAGDKSTLTFDAIEDLTISGKVIEIDTLGTVSQGVVTYSVDIAFDTQDERIKPGMSVSAAIITDAVQDILMVPNSAVKTQGDISYVEVLENIDMASAANLSTITTLIQPKQVVVKAGLSNDSETEVSGDDLKEGDLVITRTVTTGKTSTTTTKTQAGGGGPSALGGIFR